MPSNDAFCAQPGSMHSQARQRVIGVIYPTRPTRLILHEVVKSWQVSSLLLAHVQGQHAVQRHRSVGQGDNVPWFADLWDPVSMGDVHEVEVDGLAMLAVA